MASDRAKEFAAQQRAARKAEKLRKKQSNDPADWGTIRQLREVYKRTKEIDKSITWKMLLAFVVPFVISILVGVLLRPIWLWVLTGAAFGAALSMFVFSRLVRKGAYTRYKGQPGSAEVGFAELPKKKWTIETAISVNKQGDVMHRLVGRPGIVLVAEGEATRIKKMLDAERHRHEQVAYGVEVTTISMGDKEGQVPLEKLSKAIKKLPSRIDTLQIQETKSRLKALDSMRGKMPIPKGPLPTKVSRRAMRGR